jgi:hypothetical protein
LRVREGCEERGEEKRDTTPALRATPPQDEEGKRKGKRGDTAQEINDTTPALRATPPQDEEGKRKEERGDSDECGEEKRG